MYKPRYRWSDCIRCGWCCGYRRDSKFGGCEYAEDEHIPADVITEGRKIPVDEDDVCIYLEKLNNGFAVCTIQDKKPKMCKLYNCLNEQKVRQLKSVVEYLKEKCE